MNKLSVVIPALNEPYLKLLKERINDELEKALSIDYWEIIVRTDKGCGNAICEGIKEAKYDIVVVMDGDGSHNPKYISGMFYHINKGNKNLVYGYKRESNDSHFRKIVTYGFDMISRTFVLNSPDLMAGFFMFNKSVLSYPSKLEHPKVLMKIIMMNPERYVKVHVVPILFEKRKEGKSKLGNWKVAFKILKEILYYQL